MRYILIALLFAGIVVALPFGAQTDTIARNRFSRDDTELLRTVNTVFGADHVHTAEELYAHMTALIDTALETLDEGQTELGEDYDYSEFAQVFDSRVVMIEQPTQKFLGIRNVVNELIRQAVMKTEARGFSTTGLRHEDRITSQSGIQTVRAVTLQTTTGEYSSTSRTIDIYQLHVRYASVEDVPPQNGDAMVDALPPPDVVIRIIEHFGPFVNALDLGS